MNINFNGLLVIALAVIAGVAFGWHVAFWILVGFIGLGFVLAIIIFLFVGKELRKSQRSFGRGVRKW